MNTNQQSTNTELQSQQQYDSTFDDPFCGYEQIYEIRQLERDVREICEGRAYPFPR